MATTKRTPVTSQHDEDVDFIKSLAKDVNGVLKTDALMIGEDSGDDGVPYWVLTGIPQLDFAVGGLSHPGFPGARITEVYGAEGTGKSTLVVHLVKCAIQQLGAIAAYQDVERVLTPEIIKGSGINMDRVMRGQPDTLEDVFDQQEAILDILHKKSPDKPVVMATDSIAACSTKSEIEGDMEDAQMAPHARLMSKGLRKIKSPITDSQVLSLWVNQTREKIGQAFGDKDDTFGGRAMKFYASVRIKLTKIKTLKKEGKDNDPFGCTIAAKVIKNKVAPPLKEVKYDILFIQDENGSYPRIDIEGAVLDWCKDNNLIGGSTGRYEVNGKSLYKEQARQELLDNPDLMEKMVELAYSIAKPIEE